MTGSNAEQAISQEKYVSVATFRKTGGGGRNGDLDRPGRRRPGRPLDLLGLRKNQAATEQPEVDTAAERRPRPGQSRHHADDRHR